MRNGNYTGIRENWAAVKPLFSSDKLNTIWKLKQRISVDSTACCCSHLRDDVTKWKYFPRHWPFVRGIHRSPVNSPHKGQWRGALMFSLICVWLRKQSWGWWFETLSCPLWRHYNDESYTVWNQYVYVSYRWYKYWVDSFSPARWGNNFTSVFVKFFLRIHILTTACEIGKSTLVLVMAWCRRYLSQCDPSFMSPYGFRLVGLKNQIIQPAFSVNKVIALPQS